MTDILMPSLQMLTENKAALTQLTEHGFSTIFDIFDEPLEEFCLALVEVPDEQAKAIHAAACTRVETLNSINRALLSRNDPVTQGIPKLGIKPFPQELHAAIGRSLGRAVDFDDLFDERSSDGYAEVTSIQSLFSPGRYLVELYRIAKELHAEISPLHIEKRRPDIKDLVLNEDNFNKEISTLAILNEILLKGIQASSGSPDLQTLEATYYPMTLPYHDNLVQVRSVLAQNKLSLLQLWAALADDQLTTFTAITPDGLGGSESPDLTRSPKTREQLQLAPELYTVLGTLVSNETAIKRHYNLSSETDITKQLKSVDEFIARTGLSFNQLIDMTAQADYSGGRTAPTITGTTCNLSPQLKKLVNTTVAGNQGTVLSGAFRGEQGMASLADGGWLVTWNSQGQDGSGQGVYQQRFNAIGIAVGVETQVNTTTANDQGDSRVTGLADGGWLVTWTSNNQDGNSWGVYQQRHDINGAKVGAEVRVNVATLGSQGRSDVVELVGGGWVVVFEDPRSGTSHPMVQRYDVNGATVGGNITVSNMSIGQPAIARLIDGGWVVAWGGPGPGDTDSGIYMQAYNADGSTRGVATRSNTFTTDPQTKSDITGLADGGWLVSWASAGQDSSGLGIYQQRYDAAGVAQGTENRVNDVTAGDQQLAAVTGLMVGGWVVTWQSNNQFSATSGNDIYQQRYDAHGNKQGVEQLVNDIFTTGEQTLPNITATADGGWTVSWVSAGQDGSGTGIYQQHYSQQGKIVELVTVSKTVTFTFSEDPGSTFTVADVVLSNGTLGLISGTGLTRTATVTSNTANLVTNGSFTGGATGWTTSGAVNLNPNGRMTFESGSSMNGVIRQNVATVAGETYVVQFWVGGHNNTYSACTATAQALDGATALESLNTTATASGATVKFTFLATSTTTTIQLTETYDDPSNEYYFDDFVVACVPKVTIGKGINLRKSVFWRYGDNVPANVNVYGQTYISNESLEPASLLVCISDTNKLELQLSSANDVMFCDRAQRLIRLQRQVKLEFHELDWLVKNANEAVHPLRPMRLDTPVLSIIAEFTRLSTLYGISSEEFTCFIGDMNTFARKSKQSLYQRLFTLPLDGTTLALDATLNFDPSVNSANTTIVCGALKVSADELQRMAHLAFNLDKSNTVLMSSVRYAQLYRLAMIPRMLGLSFTEANVLWDLINPGQNSAAQIAANGTLDTLKIIRQTEAVLAWMVDNQLDLPTLLSMTTDAHSSVLTPELYNFTHNLFTSLAHDSDASSQQANELLSSALQQRLYQAIAPTFDSKPNIMSKLLLWQDSFFRMPDGTTAYGLGDFWADVKRVHGAEAGAKTSQASANIARYSQGMAQYALIAQWADLTEQDLSLIVDDYAWFIPGDFVGDIQTSGAKPSMPLLLRVARLKQWLLRVVVPASEAIGYFEKANQSGQTSAVVLDALARVHGWDSKQTVLMNSSLINQKIYSDLPKKSGFPKCFDDVCLLETWMQASTHLGVGSNCIAQLYEMSKPNVSAEASDLIAGVAEQLTAVIKH